MEKAMMIEDFLKKLKNETVVKHLVPLEMGMGWPMLSIRNKKLCVTVPFYKSFVQPKDNTLLYPLAYTVTTLWPSGTIIDFKSLKYSPAYKNVDITKAVGTFRHEAVKNYNREQYLEKKGELYQCYDELINNLYSSEPYLPEMENRMKENFRILLEPSLRPFYKVIDSKFYNKFLAEADEMR